MVVVVILVDTGDCCVVGGHWVVVVVVIDGGGCCYDVATCRGGAGHRWLMWDHRRGLVVAGRRLMLVVI